MRARAKLLIIGILVLFIAGTTLTADQPRPELVTPVFPHGKTETPIIPSALTNFESEANANYNCNLKVYMVEQESRWTDYTNYYHYDYGFLDFSFDTALSLAYLETYQETKIWDAQAAGWANATYVTQQNMMAIAVMFNSEIDGTGISDPLYENPDGRPFDIHLVDACASATHGHPGWDTAIGTSTHTVFIEESTSPT
jgi:hypothetical protein